MFSLLLLVVIWVLICWLLTFTLIGVLPCFGVSWGGLSSPLLFFCLLHWLTPSSLEFLSNFTFVVACRMIASAVITAPTKQLAWAVSSFISALGTSLCQVFSGTFYGLSSFSQYLCACLKLWDLLNWGMSVDDLLIGSVLTTIFSRDLILWIFIMSSPLSKVNLNSGSPL